MHAVTCLECHPQAGGNTVRFVFRCLQALGADELAVQGEVGTGVDRIFELQMTDQVALVACLVGGAAQYVLPVSAERPTANGANELRRERVARRSVDLARTVTDDLVAVAEQEIAVEDVKLVLDSSLL